MRVAYPQSARMIPARRRTRYGLRALSGAGLRGLSGPITVQRDDGTVLIVSQPDGSMADAAKPWSSAFAPPAGTGPIPDALRAAIKNAVDQADAWLKWSQHYGLNWVIYRTPAGGGAQTVVQQATPSGPVLVPQAPPQVIANGATTAPTGAGTPSPAPDVTNSNGVQPQPAAAAAPSWFAGSTEILGVQVPNVALAGALLLGGLLFMGGDAPGRRGR